MIRFIKNLVKKAIRLFRKRPSNNMFWTGREEKCPNFGDLIGPYLFEKITGNSPIFASTSNLSLNSVYMSAGSLMSWCRENSVIWGSGIVQRGQRFPKPQAVYAVRGPITRDHFIDQGYYCPEVYGDPALLMPIFYSPENIVRKYNIGIVPHYVDKKISRKYIKSSKLLTFIDVFDPIEEVVNQILSCNFIFSSSLHGIIISHAYNIPAVWCKFSDKLWGDDVKFHDYFSSLGMKTPKPKKIDDIFTFIDLERMCAEAITPDPITLKNIQNELLRKCPFIVSKSDH